MIIKEAEIHVTGECLHNCVFCSVKKHQGLNPPLEEIKENIKLSKLFNKLILSGGEPFIRKDIFEIIKSGKKYQKNLAIETNLVLLDKTLLEQIIKLKVTELKISFHSNKKLAYQKITQSKHFNNLINNLNLLKKYKHKIKVTTNTVITKYNYLHLHEIVKFLNKNYSFISQIRISYPRFYPIKGHKNYSKPYLIPLEKLREQLKKIEGKNIIFENIPLCILDDKRAEKINWNIKLIKHHKILVGLEGRYFPEKCVKCNKKKNCQGLHKYYSLYFKENFIKPFN